LTVQQAKSSVYHAELKKLRPEIVKLGKSVKGQFGVYVKHIESGAELAIEADKIYPLGSVFKVALMAEVYRQAHEGLLSMDEEVELEKRHYCIGSGILQYLSPGLKLKVRDLLTLMMIANDNTASQMLWKRVGVQSVNMFLRDLGLAKTIIYLPFREEYLMSMGYGPFKDLTIVEAARRWHGLSDIDRMKVMSEVDKEAANLSVDDFRRGYQLIYGVKDEKRYLTQRAYDEVFDNQGTPREIGFLLERIFKREVVSKKACDEMLDILMVPQAVSTVPRSLSPDTPVISRAAGDSAGSVNEAGVIFTSPTSHIVFTCFYKRLEEGWAEKARSVQSSLSKLIHDSFVRLRPR